jgi:hypothetical protein
MGLEIALGEGREENVMRNGFTLEERLYKTEDGEVVREGDERAVTVYRGIGQQISLSEAVALGLNDESPDFDLTGLTSVSEADDVQLIELFLAVGEELKKRDLIEFPDHLRERADALFADETSAPTAPAAAEEGQAQVGADGVERTPEGETVNEAGEVGDKASEVEQREDLLKLTRPVLDERALTLGVEEPGKLPNKGAVVDAVLVAQGTRKEAGE